MSLKWNVALTWFPITTGIAQNGITVPQNTVIYSLVVSWEPVGPRVNFPRDDPLSPTGSGICQIFQQIHKIINGLIAGIIFTVTAPSIVPTV